MTCNCLKAQVSMVSFEDGNEKHMKTWNQLFQTVKISHKSWNELNIRKLQHFPNCAGWIASLTEGSQVSWQNSGNGSKNTHAQRSFLVATASEQMSPCYLWHTPVLCISLASRPSFLALAALACSWPRTPARCSLKTRSCCASLCDQIIIVLHCQIITCNCFLPLEDMFEIAVMDGDLVDKDFLIGCRHENHTELTCHVWRLTTGQVAWGTWASYLKSLSIVDTHVIT